MDDRTEQTPTEADRLPSPPHGASRIDTLAEEFVRSISRRPLEIGDVIAARYKLVAPLGDGGMGQVFVAENLAIGRRVAIKVLKPELLSDPLFRKRFQHEAMAIAAIEHRNVVRFSDLIVGDPTFLVMEYVPGPTLSSVLRQGRLEIDRAVRIGLRLAWALDTAHRAGVVHRDIKPSNVILTPDSELGEEPKLIDFGLAKLPTLVGAEELTRTGQIVGTPRYMSPEQIANKNVGPPSDVYALGCLLFQMLTGRLTVDGEEHVQVLYQQLHVIPAPLTQLVPDAPPALEELLQRALAKHPSGRPASMREVALTLSAILSELSSTRPEASNTPATGSRSSARFPSWRVAVFSIVLFALGGLAVGLVRRPIEQPRGGLIITSRPPAANVEIDGNPVAELTPTALRGLPAGKHRVRVHQHGRNSAERVVTLVDGERLALDIAIPPASHSIEVQTIPSGASLFVDGSQWPGATPMTVSLADDDFHELRVEKLGYGFETRALKPEDRGPVVSIPLRPEHESRGLVMVDSATAAEVWIDGKNTGFITPTTGIQVTAGAHTVDTRTTAGEHSPLVRVSVHQGETVHLTLNVGANQ